MNALWLDLYQRLPYRGRSVVASLHGMRLRRWRYGPESESLIRAALDRERWSQAEWRQWCSGQLDKLLRLAATEVPYYRSQWAAPNAESAWRQLDAWPVLGKEPLRRDPLSFLASSRSTRGMYREQTSGTSGTPLELWWSRDTVRRWYALNAARVLHWNGVDRDSRWGIFGGRMVTSVHQTRPPYWVWNAAMRQLYLSSYHLSSESAEAYVDALRAHRVEYLWAYPSALFELAVAALEQNLDVPKLEFVVVNAEPLLLHQREAISQAFSCPVRETYGLAEIVAAASECESGTLHLWPEVGVVEVLADQEDRPVASGEVGRLVCTGLLNTRMPLIRYDTGDRGRLPAGDERCDCGRRLPILNSVEGRRDDVIVTSAGRRIGRLDPVFKTDLPLREAQVVQESLDHLRVKVLPGQGFSERDQVKIQQRLAQRVGAGMKIEIELVDQIPRGPAGKFRSVVSKL